MVSSSKKNDNAKKDDKKISRGMVGIWQMWKNYF